MGQDSRIEWTDHTFNPWIGCSMGCGYCYAERMNRWRKFVPDWRSPRLTSASIWDRVRRWDLAARAGWPARVFCGSLCDFFDPEVPDVWRLQVLRVMAETPHLRWLVLTKRPEYMNSQYGSIDVAWPLPNVWLGVSITNQADAGARIPELLQTPATGRFVSCEPLVGAVDLTRLGGDEFGWGRLDSLLGLRYTRANATDTGCEWETEKARGSVDWVIAGGMTGPDATPLHPDWVRSLRDQCQVAGVPFFFKQWGDVVYVGNANASGYHLKRIGNKAAGRGLDGQLWDQVPEALEGR